MNSLDEHINITWKVRMRNKEEFTFHNFGEFDIEGTRYIVNYQGKTPYFERYDNLVYIKVSRPVDGKKHNRLMGIVKGPKFTVYADNVEVYSSNDAAIPLRDKDIVNFARIMKKYDPEPAKNTYNELRVTSTSNL